MAKKIKHFCSRITLGRLITRAVRILVTRPKGSVRDTAALRALFGYDS